MVMGLTTGLWVSAQVRLCDRAFIPATVVRRGDPDAGASRPEPQNDVDRQFFVLQDGARAG